MDIKEIKKRVHKELQFKKDYNILRQKIKKFIDISPEHKIKILIKKELEKKEKLFNHDKKYYRNKIYFSSEKNCLDNLDLEIVFCNGNKDLIELWNYFKIMSSSAVTCDQGYGSIKYMIKDRITNTYLGVVELGNDIYNCAPRDTFIGWTPQLKKQKIKIINNLEKSLISFIINITCCIGLQPMAHNLNIGKLLVASVFSQEVMEYFYKIRGYHYACVTTFGLYGKSVQYDRLKQIKYIGETKGTGTCFLSHDLYDELVYFLKKYYEDVYEKCSNMSSSKMRLIQYGLQLLNIDQSLVLLHGYKRGIYIGYTSKESEKFLNGKLNSFQINNNIQKFNLIVEWWKNRWAFNRLKYLNDNFKFKIKYELKDFTLFEKKQQYNKQYYFDKMNDKDFIKGKKEKSLSYYYNHKETLLEEVKIKLNNYDKNNYYIDNSYLGGFFDSDGSIYIDNNNYVIAIGFYQCVLNIILSIQEKYGGTIFLNKKRNNNSRNCYTLRITGKHCEKILHLLNKTSVLKASKIKLALDYLQYINKPMSESKKEIIELLKNEQKNDLEEYFNRINDKYIAGIFDGDGSVYLNYQRLEYNKLNVRLTIVQKYTPKFLNYLKNYLKEKLNTHIGLCDDRIYMESIEGMENFYQMTKFYLIVKKYQFSKMHEIIHYYQNSTIKNFEKIIELANDIKNNKHENIEYEVEIDKVNMVENMKQNILLKQSNLEESEEKHIQSIEKQRLKKTGINNVNYGKKMSDDHVCKISTESSKTKRAKNPNLTDEKIHEIYSLKDKIMQKDVAEKYNMNREMIRRIWNRKLLPTDDPEFKTNVLNKKILKNNDHAISTSLGKRSLTTTQYIEIILWKQKKNNGELLNGKKITSTKLAEVLSEKMKTKITTDIIKNIWNGRTKLFESDFIGNETMTYQIYQTIIQK